MSIVGAILSIYVAACCALLTFRPMWCVHSGVFPCPEAIRDEVEDPQRRSKFRLLGLAGAFWALLILADVAPAAWLRSAALGLQSFFLCVLVAYVFLHGIVWFLLDQDKLSRGSELVWLPVAETLPDRSMVVGMMRLAGGATILALGCVAWLG